MTRIAHQIFLGVTPSAMRTFMAEEIRRAKPARFISPCAGRFTVQELLRRGGYPGEIRTSDISIFSALIGHVCDPEHTVSELEITIPDDAPGAPADVNEDPIGFAARVLFYLEFAQVRSGNLYSEHIRSEYRSMADQQIARIREQLEGLCATFSPEHGLFRYDSRDMMEVIAEYADDQDAVIYAYPPLFNAGYTKMFTAPGLKWNEPNVPQFETEQVPAFIEAFRDARAHSLFYFRQDVSSANEFQHNIPPGWTSMFAQRQGGFRADHLLSNRPTVCHVPPLRDPKGAKELPIYADEEITPDSEIRFIAVDRETALYYRDLFVHKLGITDAESFFLMLVDGRVVTTCGFMNGQLRTFQSDFVFEIFAITKSSARYPRLNQLYLLASTSGGMRNFLELPENQSLQLYGLRPAQGIRTAYLRPYRHGGQARSMKHAELVSCEKQKGRDVETHLPDALS